MMPAPSLIIKHSGAAAEVFAPTLAVLTVDQQGKALALAQACAMDVTDAASLAKANDLAVVAKALEKEIEDRKEYLNRPLLDVGKALRSIIDGVHTPLITARKSLIGKIADYDRRQREAAAAVARKAAEDAENERKRLQAIADEEHAKVVAAAKARAEAEAKELEAILGAPVVPEPVAVAPAPVVKVAAVAVAAPTPAASVVSKIVPELVVDESHPDFAPFYVGAETLVTVNRAAVKRALDAGAVLPWARMVMKEQIGMRGVRS